MTAPLAVPLAPFADALPVPERLVAAQQDGRLSVPIRAGAHRFHRDLPESAVWGYDGTVPGPTILGHTIDDNERGLKDTVRVNPNEIAEIAVRFTTYSGRYMYHCHILEHEDRDMMRPFVTMPAELMPFMA